MSEKLRILLVDDEAIVRDSLVAWLEDEGFQVFAAEGGEQALEIISGQEVDAAVLDIKMPGMDGLTLLKKIHARNSTLPVIMITAHVTVESAVKSMSDGAYDYIMKPFPPEKLTNSLRNVLEHRRLKRTFAQIKAEYTTFESWLSVTKELSDSFAVIRATADYLNSAFPEAAAQREVLAARIKELEACGARLQSAEQQLGELQSRLSHTLKMIENA